MASLLEDTLLLLPHGTICICREDLCCCVESVLTSNNTHLLTASAKHSAHIPPSQKGPNSEKVMHCCLVKLINSYPNGQQSVVKTATVMVA